MQRAATKEMDLYESENCDAQDRSVMLSVGNFNSGQPEKSFKDFFDFLAYRPSVGFCYNYTQIRVYL